MRNLRSIQERHTRRLHCRHFGNQSCRQRLKQNFCFSRVGTLLFQRVDFILNKRKAIFIQHNNASCPCGCSNLRFEYCANDHSFNLFMTVLLWMCMVWKISKFQDVTTFIMRFYVLGKWVFWSLFIYKRMELSQVSTYLLNNHSFAQLWMFAPVINYRQFLRPLHFI